MKLEDLTMSTYYKLIYSTDSTANSTTSGCNKTVRIESMTESDRSRNATNWLVVDQPYLAVYVSKDDYYVLAHVDIANTSSIGSTGNVNTTNTNTSINNTGSIESSGSCVEFNKNFYNCKDKSIMLHGVHVIKEYVDDYVKNKDFETLVGRVVGYCDELLNHKDIRSLHERAQLY